MSCQKTLRFEIPGRFPGMNEIVEAAKAHYKRYAEMKRTYTDMVAWCAKAAKVPPMDRVRISIVWVEPDNRRDFDNVSAGQKFLLDGLVQAGVLQNDTRWYVRSVAHTVKTDKTNPRVIVTLEEVEQEHG